MLVPWTSFPAKHEIQFLLFLNPGHQISSYTPGMRACTVGLHLLHTPDPSGPALDTHLGLGLTGEFATRTPIFLLGLNNLHPLLILILSDF
jgi:hypothetical protein